MVSCEVVLEERACQDERSRGSGLEVCVGRMERLGLADTADVSGDWCIGMREMMDWSFSKWEEGKRWQGARGAFAGDGKVWRTAVWGCRDVEGEVNESDQSRSCGRVCTAILLDTEETETDA